MSDPAAAALLFGYGATASGSQVTPETALRVPAVYASVKVISESIAQLPLVLYRRLPDGGKEPAEDHPLFSLLASAPNAWTTSVEFRQAMQSALCAYGNAYAYVSRNAAGRVVELIFLHPTQVAVEVDQRSMEPLYRVTDLGGTQRVYSRAEVFHLRTLNVGTLSGYVGVSPLTQIAEAIGLAMALEEHGARLFSNGARPGGLFKYGKQLSAPILERLRDQLAGQQAGGANSGKTMILEDGMSFEPLTFNSVDAQFLELRQHQIAEIARAFRIPLHKLGELSRSTNNNIATQNGEFLTDCLLPQITAWEQAISLSLLTPEERKEYFAEFDLDDFSRADILARFQAYALAITNGVMNPNEVRATENLPGYGPEGDVFTRQLNTAPAAPAMPAPPRGPADA